MSTSLHPVPGVLVGTGSGGIKQRGRDDVAIFAFARPVPTAAVFTRNKFAAAPIQVARKHLRGGHSQAWLINSGNANCGTGKRGLAVADSSCAHLGTTLGTDARQVMPFSTGVIMEQLNQSRLHAGCDKAVRKLAANNWQAAARAIMTTDTKAKGASVRVRAKAGKLTITGIAKGSGMIHPDMATMLAFIATDAAVSVSWLRQALRQSVKHSFNAISVDGDSSTNDAVAVVATGAAGTVTPAQLRALATALDDVCTNLAWQVVRDGEGATTTCVVTVTGLTSDSACQIVANAVACSPLIKTMLHARDANIGRLLMAIGKAPVRLDANAVSIKINGKQAFQHGERRTNFTEAVASKAMRADPVTIDICAGKAPTAAKRIFCDLSARYISINADYRS